MRRYGNRSIVALEDGESADVAAVDESTAPASVEAGEKEAEVVESSDEGTELDDAIDDGAEVATALESMALAMKISAANGGMDKYSANVVSIATQYMYGRVGIKSRAMPALESFGGSSTRIGATQLAMEGIKETAKTIWEYIVKAYKKVLAWATGHFRKLFGAAEAMKKRAEAIGKNTDNYSTKKIKDKTFDNAGIVKKLYNGTGVTVATLTANLETLATLTKTILGTNAEARLSSGDKLVDAIEADSKASTLPVIETMGANKDLTSEQTKLIGAPTVEFAWKASDSLPGGMIWAEHMMTPAPSDAAGKLKSYAKTKMKFVSDATKKPSKETLTTLKLNEIETISESVVKIADVLIDFKKVNDKLKVLLERVTKAAERMSKNADNEIDAMDQGTAVQGESEEDKTKRIAAANPNNAKDVAEKEYGKLIRSATDNIKNYVLNTFVNASSYPLSVGQASLSYCEQSFKQYE